MLEDLFKNPSILKFIRNYSKDKWETIIEFLVQLGIIHLNKNYNNIKFDEDNLRAIICKIKLKKQLILFQIT
jgi:hypothetical protein